MGHITICTLSVIADSEPQSPRIIRIFREIADQDDNPETRSRLVRNDKAF